MIVLVKKDVFCFIQHYDLTINYVGSCFYADAVVIVSAVILLFLFLLQSFGTHKVSFLFSPIMVAWFLSTALIGVYNIIIYYPGVFKALSPHYIFLFFMHHGKHGWVMLGAIVLCITGNAGLDTCHLGGKNIGHSKSTESPETLLGRV